MHSGRLGYRGVCRLAVIGLLASSALWGCGTEALQPAARDAGEDFGAKGPTTGRDAVFDLGPVDFWDPPEQTCGNEVLDPGEDATTATGSAATGALRSVRSSVVGPARCPGSPASA